MSARLEKALVNQRAVRGILRDIEYVNNAVNTLKHNASYASLEDEDMQSITDLYNLAIKIQSTIIRLDVDRDVEFMNAMHEIVDN